MKILFHRHTGGFREFSRIPGSLFLSFFVSGSLLRFPKRPCHHPKNSFFQKLPKLDRFGDRILQGTTYEECIEIVRRENDLFNALHDDGGEDSDDQEPF